MTDKPEPTTDMSSVLREVVLRTAPKPAPEGAFTKEEYIAAVKAEYGIDISEASAVRYLDADVLAGNLLKDERLVGGRQRMVWWPVTVGDQRKT